MVDRTVTSSDLVAAFDRLRDLWKGLYDELPPKGAREDLKKTFREGLETVRAAARVSGEARPFVELAYLVRMDEWRTGPGALPAEAEEAAAGARSGFEMRLRTLRQMESGDEILSDTGREIRRSAARDLVFFRELTGRSGRKGKDAAGGPERALRSFDPRRRLVSEEVDVPNAAIEAIEFLVRLGAG